MPIVYACIAPHGGHLLLGKNERTPVPKSRAAMATIEREMRDANPDSIAILTPHGVHVAGNASFAATARGRGEYAGAQVDAPIDLALTQAWALHASDSLPSVLVRSDQPGEWALELDWGVVIPLALLGAGLDPETPIAVICPSPSLSRPQLVDLGAALVDAADEVGRRVALIVSADQGHGHAADGRYGFAPESADYDAKMNEAVQADNLASLLDWPEEFPEAALADSYWQTLCLLGVQQRVPLTAHFRSYEVDHYFGQMCASFRA